MNTVIKIGLLATTVLSGVALANQYKTSTTNQTAIYTSDGAATQAEAAEMATSYIESLQNLDAFELSQKLPTPHRRIDKRSMELNATEVEVVSEQAEDGSTAHVAKVTINYSYDYRNRKGRSSGGGSASSASVSEPPQVSTPDTSGSDTPSTDFTDAPQ
jgi:hypothetical protein